MPFAFLIIIGSVQSIGDDILDAARDLGAGRFARLRRIILPLTLRSLQAALVLIFIGAAGDYSFQAVAGPQTSIRCRSSCTAFSWIMRPMAGTKLRSWRSC